VGIARLTVEGDICRERSLSALSEGYHDAQSARLPIF
jgi:hypothetical protein